MSLSAPRPGIRRIAGLLRRRPVLSGNTTVLLVALHFLFLANLAFWTSAARAAGSFSSRLTILGSIALVLFVVLVVLGTLISFKGVFKVIAGTLLLVSVIVDHLMLVHGALIDSTMVQNVVETHSSEVFELITPRLVVHLVVLGLVPLLMLLRIRIRYRRPLAELGIRAAMVFGGLISIWLLSLVTNLPGFARNNRELQHQITPFNYLAAIGRYVREQGVGPPGPLISLGTDARQSVSARERERRKLIVLVVGETARAANFSLNGYARNTNPRLARQGVVSYRSFQACGTSTATSLPCMFSGIPRSDYGREHMNRENLLDVLDHAGIRVLWRENNAGCKGLCDRVETDKLAEWGIPEYCSNGACVDEILLHGLDDFLMRVENDTLIVLHQQGSHGPAYYLRYPPEFGQFAPACETNDLHRCDRESVVNAYDNTILYTDHVLGLVIDLLRRHSDRLDTGMIYVSDHGESLGERGVYLHGLPFSIAPDEQTRVPFIVWFSSGLIGSSGLDPGCIAAGRDVPSSHDNLVHSILGLMDVETALYNPELDLFHPCQRSRHAEGEGT